MKLNWFKTYGWAYLPVSIPAFVLTALLMAAFIHDFLFIDSRAHSVSDTYYGFAPYGFMYVASWFWIASRTARA